MDLNRSVRLLEDALSPHGKSLLRTGTPKKMRYEPRKSGNQTNLDLSITVAPEEMRHILENGMVSVVDTTLQTVLLQNSTITGTTIINTKPWETAADALFVEYLEVIQARTNINEIFDTVSDLARCCTDTLNVVKGLKSKIRTADFGTKWLENERNTWRLIFCLYQDRIGADPGERALMPYLGVSEKLCIESLYRRDSLVREAQLIIDWLECNALDREIDEPKIQHFTDRTVGWENTLHQLQASESIVFRSSRPIVTRMDPDAPLREKLPLHDLDIEDEERLCKKIFREIRCGRLEEAQALCIHCGHPWRSALLEGWRLYHDPNINYEERMEEDDDDVMDSVSEFNVEEVQEKARKRQTPQDLQPVEGNSNRDIWKNTALIYCEQKNLNIYDRASTAAFCGCLKSLLPVCTSWEDQLWAYMRTMVDIRVESEIRDFVPKEYVSLPAEYWNNKMSLDEIFEKISTSKDIIVREEAHSPDHLIQKFLILDQIPKLMTTIEGWISAGETTPQFLRFLAHLILFLKQIGQSQRDDIADKVLEAYVKCLMERNEPQLVAYYVATLGQHQQINLYSSFLENITDNGERKLALQFGEDAGLNIKTITKHVVENIRYKPDFDEISGNLQRTITENDKIKISALDWLLFYPTQRAEAIIQCNALISYFLTLGKVDSAKAAFSKIPVSALETLLSIPDEEVPETIQHCIREHMCYRAYLDSHEAFNDWFKYFHHSRPQQPLPLPENATFTEKVAYEHRVSQHKAETERWKLTVSHLAKTAKTKLYNVLLFPDGGWLNGSESPSHLRGSCIPEVVLLLYSVLSESGNHTECIQLADLIASEEHQIYKVYTKENLEDILKKCFESSIILLDEKKDMWGTYG